MNGQIDGQPRTYQDFELWIGPPSAAAPPFAAEYPVHVVMSPDGYGEGVLKFALAPDDFEGELARVRGIERDPDLRMKFGKRLFDALFAGQVLLRWKGSQARLKGIYPPPGLRLRLDIVDPNLALLPWELLYDQEAGFLGATANQTVARYLPMPEPVNFAMPGRVRVLVIVSNPPEGMSETLKPIPPGEIEQLKATLDGLKDLGVDYRPLVNKSIGEIFDALQEEYHVLHYVGHGGSGELYLIDEKKTSFEAVDAQSFAQYFLGRPSLRLVVLNACSSAQADPDLAGRSALFAGVGPSLIQRGVPAVIAMQYHSVYSATALVFSQRFYTSLAKGLPVEVAVNEARQALSVAHLAERDWSTPVLYLGTRTGRILTLPDPPGQRGPVASLPVPAVPPQSLADLATRTNRLREWLEVQRTLLNVRRNLDVLYAQIREARRTRPEQLLDRAEAIQETWYNFCAADVNALSDVLQKLRYVCPAPTGDGALPGSASVAGWRGDLDTARDALQNVVTNDLPNAVMDMLPTTLADLDAKCRPLRDWLRDRDADCSNWLKEEAGMLAGLAGRLCEQAQAPDHWR
jgi:hypothetical protein